MGLNMGYRGQRTNTNETQKDRKFIDTCQFPKEKGGLNHRPSIQFFVLCFVLFPKITLISEQLGTIDPPPWT